VKTIGLGFDGNNQDTIDSDWDGIERKQNKFNRNEMG
jgi:hypothetical protein